MKPTSTKPAATKPTLRGYIHQEAFFIFLGACALLIAKSSDPNSTLAATIYSIGVLSLFGISAIYHRPHWEPAPRTALKKFDHSAIFLLIGGTFTPFALLALPPDSGQKLLWTIWLVALAGILQSFIWVKAPKWVTASFYIATGWLILPYTEQLQATLGTNHLILIVAGGLTYTVGAVFYALHKPNLFPGKFGYHELFHLMTVIAAALHFIVIYKMIH
jgi:hemolysin III